MFDTNVFNDILDGGIDLAEYKEEYDMYGTHVQLDEIKATPDEDRRTKLLGTFSDYLPCREL